MEMIGIALYLLGCLIVPSFLLNLLLVPFQILDHEILASEFEMVTVVIDALGWRQMEIVQDFINRVSLDPQDVPVLPTLTLHCYNNELTSRVLACLLAC